MFFFVFPSGFPGFQRFVFFLGGCYTPKYHGCEHHFTQNLLLRTSCYNLKKKTVPQAGKGPTRNEIVNTHTHIYIHIYIIYNVYPLYACIISKQNNQKLVRSNPPQGPQMFGISRSASGSGDPWELRNRLLWPGQNGDPERFGCDGIQQWKMGEKHTLW